jgi:hypothetical protein
MYLLYDTHHCRTVARCLTLSRAVLLEQAEILAGRAKPGQIAFRRTDGCEIDRDDLLAVRAECWQEGLA